MQLRDYHPEPQLRVKSTIVDRPRFTVIDAHNHLGGAFGGGWDERPVSELLEVLDKAGVGVYVDLDGGWGETILQRHLDHFKAAAPERFVHFGGVDWSKWSEKGDSFGEWAAGRMREQIRWGAGGLKIWKGFGLSVRDPQGKLAPVDDPRIDPVWEAAAELEIPVLIHIADPVAFFDPLDERNERWEELHAHPDWHFPTPDYPPFRTVIDQLASLVARHPQTIFIGAHVGCYAENLGWVSDLLDRAANFNVDIGARISELGRQPYTARRFFLDYPDRILFGTDMGADLDTYRIYYRFLETDDEYINYSTEPVPPQGRWQIYGLHLPDDVLAKVYYQNAQRVLRLPRE